MVFEDPSNNKLTGPIVTEEELNDEEALPDCSKRPWFAKVLDHILIRRRRGYEVVPSSSESSDTRENAAYKRARLRRKPVCVGIILLFTMGAFWLWFWKGFIHVGQYGATTFRHKPTPWERPWWLGDVVLHSISIAENPIPCHSHNDFTEQKIPLFDAINTGCTSVEADVWPANGTLWLGHEFPDAPWRWTFRQVYVSPLVELLDWHNRNENQSTEHLGIFPSEPFQPLVLLIDFKANGSETFSFLQEELAPLRDKNYLTYYDGTSIIQRPITVVASGNAPFNLLIANQSYRDVFFDAPLARLTDEISAVSPDPEGGQGLTGISEGPDGVAEPFDWTNSYSASVSLQKTIGLLPFAGLRQKDVAKIRNQVEEAHRRGLKARYWGTPTIFRWRRRKIWKLLWKEGVDYLNVDHLQDILEFFKEQAR